MLARCWSPVDERFSGRVAPGGEPGGKYRRPGYRQRRSTSKCTRLDVQFLRLFRAVHDEAEARRGVLAHQLVDDAIGDDLIGDLDAQQPAASSG